MWKRNALFILLVVAGVSFLANSLVPANRIADPADFQPNRIDKKNYSLTVQKVNDEFRTQWAGRQLDHAPRADNLTIARRLSLGLTGSIPSLEEIRALEQVKPEHQIEWWVSRLLEDRRYSDYVAERLARTYVGTENGPFLLYRRRRFTHWLSESLRDNIRYDQITRSLLSDKGLWTDSPSVNFITVTVDDSENQQPHPISLAARTSRAFLGMRIDCLQCHDDQLGNVKMGTPTIPAVGTQQNFHQLAAFFANTTASAVGIADNGKAPYTTKFLGSVDDQEVPPKVPFGQEYLPSSGTLRNRLAGWVTHEQNRPFARAIVNRMWALLFGKPLVNPIDDIPLHAEFLAAKKFPPGLETLVDDFIANGYDLQRLIRLIAATEVFQLDSRGAFQVLKEHEDAWAVFPISRLRPEQVSGSLVQSTSLTTIDANAHLLDRIRLYAEQNEFIQRYGDTGEDEFTDRGGTIPQRLLMMNGQLLDDRTEGNGALLNAVSQISVLAPNDADAIETAYLVIFTRRPSETERAAFAKVMGEAKNVNQKVRALEDLYWVLLNRTEFSWNH